MLMKLEDALSPEAKAELMRPVMTFDPRMAQVIPGIDPKWHLVQVYSRDAEKELAKRGFGLYVPEQRETIVRRGRKIDCRRPMFPGYVLVFMWNGGGNWGFVRACEGVIDFIGTLYDEEVDLIRAVENAQKFPRFKPRQTSRIGKAASASMRRRRWEDWLEQIRALDSGRRNQALRKLLSLF